jgi:putative peptide maturation dehydrogenase
VNVRRSAHVVLTWHPSRREGDAEAFALLTGERIPLTAERLADLLAIPEDAFVPRDDEWVEDLCRKGLLLTDGPGPRSVEHRRREAALRELGWDFESAFFYLAKRLEGTRGSLGGESQGPTAAIHELPDPLDVVELPLTEPRSDLYGLLLRRRTERAFDEGRELPLERLSILLRYIWGAHASGHDRHGDRLFKKTSPSGGSLHPLEVYPLLAHVQGVEPGLYHYSVGRHALELMERIEREAVAELAEDLTAGQDWFAGAQAFFLVTARFDRSYAKYRHDPVAYQALLLEAGHFSQTHYLVATELGLGPFVTSVINHADVDRRLGLDPYREGTLMILGCGLPAASSQETHPDPFVPRETELDA